MSNRPRDSVRVLHVDDEPEFAELAATFLERADERFTVETATSAEEGLERVAASPPDCLVSDYNMPGLDGIEFLAAVREDQPGLPFVLFTGRGSEDIASEAVSAGVTDYLQKGSGTEQYELLANRIDNAVDAREHAERADRQEELMRLTEFAGDTGGWELDLSTGAFIMTGGTRRLLGLAEEETISLAEAIEFYHPDDRKSVRAALDRATETGEEVNGTWRFETVAGDERVADVTITPVEKNGSVEQLRGAVHDVTDHRERERELEAERQFVDQSLDALTDVFYVVDGEGALERWNERVCEVTGYTDAGLSEMQAIDVFARQDRERVTDAMKRVLSTGQTTVEANLLTADGEQIPYEFTGARLSDTEGTVTGLVGIGRDLTERREREQRFRALIEESSAMISVIDANGRFQYQSPSIERVLGHDPEETVGDTAFEYVHPDDRDAVACAFETGIDNPDATPVVEYRTRHADGSWRWVEARGNNQLANPAVEGYVINVREITARKRREESPEQTTEWCES
jgi:PAS domain S-box-containing protein